ncbi:hypothetical protein Q3H59_004233 [Pantoea sp. SORGH_AS 659]|nr:hypothetical protein [Pantoea sp. SORGH_AS_0659]
MTVRLHKAKKYEERAHLIHIRNDILWFVPQRIQCYCGLRIIGDGGKRRQVMSG